MMKYQSVVIVIMISAVYFLAVIAVSTALPVDNVIYKLGDGPRFQYMSGPDGAAHLVDLWFKTSDAQASARYNPATDNHYHLFTRSNPNKSQPIPYGNEAELQKSNFKADRKTVVLTHGWLNTPQSDFNVHLISAYLIAEDVNVIMVDWSEGAGGLYVVAFSNSIRSGEHVATFINWLNGVSGANLANYHIIGHSLGGHMAGIIGREVAGLVPYLTALDPALPGWVGHPSALRETDAIYTEVVHTDAGQRGLILPAGHVDFYPNGGRSMPGCDDGSCNHHQCIFYMAESLMHGGFTGRECSSVTQAMGILSSCNGSKTLKMGGTTPKSGNGGIFHFTTNAYSPYSRG